MSVLTIPNTFTTGQTITAASHNANNTAISTEYNAHAVQTDVAKTITVTHTFTPVQTFSGGLTSAGAINAAGQAVSGNFTGPLTGAVTGNVTGNASTATALQTARAINGVNFDGSAPITVTAAAATLTGTMKPAADALLADFNTTSGTAVDVGLVLTLGVNEVWVIQFQGNLVSPAAGTTVGWVPTGTVTGAGSIEVANFSGGLLVNRGALAASPAGTTGAVSGGGAFWGGYRVAGGASGGTVKLQTFSATAGQTSTIGAGSSFLATRIA